jgi:hypothetical protein
MDNIPGYFNKQIKNLCFADFEHFGAAIGANTLSGGTAVLHGDLLGIFHFLLCAAFHTITLHSLPPIRFV